MSSLAGLVQQSTEYGWLYIPSAIALGALHGLEPGHSKTLMAAFIIAVRGTVKQAVLLGVSAAISHSAVVWLVALIGLYWGNGKDTALNEPYFQLFSALIIVAIGAWMIIRVYRTHAAHAHAHNEGHDHHHEHEDSHALAHAHDIKHRFEGRQVTTGQIILFGLTGGLLPCPAAITVLLVCLQLKQLALGMVLVVCFSIGLALTLVASGVVAALGARAASRKVTWLPKLMENAPYLAGIIMLGIGATLAVDALNHM